MNDLEVPVLIAGGGGCGLASSVQLSRLGIRSLLIERHPAPGRLPKARYVSQRSMELMRQFGVADRIYAKSMPLKHIAHIRWCTTLAGDGELDRRTFYRIESFGGGSLTHYAQDSPCESTLFPQVRMEPLLQEVASASSLGELRYNHELVSFTQDADGVTALVEDRASGNRYTVRAKYLIGADGGKTVGPSVGAVFEGQTDLAHMVIVYFKADLSQYWDDDYSMTTWFVNPEGGSWASGVLGQLGPTRFGRHSEEWMFHFSFRPDDPSRFEEASLLPRMRELLKVDVKPEIIGIGHWTVEGVQVNHYRWGRALLAGDAAHRHPPTTGLGLNSAFQDAQNLTWKLAAVLKQQAPDSLLDTYETERHPVAASNIQWALMTFQNHQLTDGGIGLVRGNPEASLANFRRFFADNAEGRTRRARLARIMEVQRMEWQAHDIELGYHYEEGAVQMDGTPTPIRDPLGQTYMPTTRPGHRLPHAWLEREGGDRLSTLDLVQPGRFVLITGEADSPWAEAAQSLARRHGIDLDVVPIADDTPIRDADRRWRVLREVSRHGAVLVRPDQHVGWRSMGAHAQPHAALAAALGRILQRDLTAV